MKNRQREAGILMPIFSLAGEYGIGSFGKEARDFVDLLQETGNRIWQILPMGPTGFGDSPYQSFSTFAGNPYFIDLPTLKDEGLLTEEDLMVERESFSSCKDKIDYGLLYTRRFPTLRKAYENWKIKGGDVDSLLATRSKESFDYCLFMALKGKFDGRSWLEFPKEYRNKEASAIERFIEENKDEIAFYAFMQQQYEKQWKALQDYAHEREIRILGDIPIYCAMDSADVWGNRKMFDFSWKGRNIKEESARDMEAKGYPGFVAGVPPDAFSETGQLWGNPLYDWEAQEKDNYAWWCRRMEYCFSRFDLLRVDHFRGFEGYYAVPYAAKTAINGEWRKGPGLALFEAFQKYFNKKELPMIAEDLGVITEGVRDIIRAVGCPGMKVLQFAFDSDFENVYLPHMYEDNNSVIYTGTHDNDTLKHWFETVSEDSRNRIYRYLSRSHNDWNAMTELLIKKALSATSFLAVIPAGDYLELSAEGRINAPGTDEGNWQWRMEKNAFTEEKKAVMREMLRTYGRFA